MSARTILKHVYENGGMTEYQYERIDRVLKERERPHGEWEYTGCVNDELQSEFCCSICDFTTYYQYNFCPNCGSDNRKRGEAE